MEISMYVLHGTWYSHDDGVTEVLGVSEDIGPLLERLAGIADSRAEDYIGTNGYLQEERGERYYEAVDGGWGYAKFYITEHRLEATGKMMDAMRRQQASSPAFCEGCPRPPCACRAASSGWDKIDKEKQEGEQCTGS